MEQHSVRDRSIGGRLIINALHHSRCWFHIHMEADVVFSVFVHPMTLLTNNSVDTVNFHMCVILQNNERTLTHASTH